MASDRWRDHDPSPAPTENSKSNGIHPSSFYKKLRSNEQPTAAEKQLDNLLHLAARNEVVQKRHEFTAVQKNQREAYHSMTSFKVFPLQDLAMEYLTEMMKDYLGYAKLTLQPGQPSRREDIVDRVKNKLDDLDEPLENQLENQKRRKIGMHDLRTKYTARFIAEMQYLSPTENGKNNQVIEGLDGNDGQCQNVMGEYRFLPELWSMEPRIFALETSSTGKRKYIVGNLGRFLQHYWRECRSRHFYELIPEGTPCRLYFDIEFSKGANPQITSDESELLITELIDELCSEFKLIYGILLERSCIVDLDSCTDKKFSRHLIIHLPNGELFADACVAGVFVKRFVGRLAEELSTGTLEGRRATLAKYLFVKKHAPKTTESESLQSDDTTEHNATTSQKNGFDNKAFTCFVDLGVYTRNRLFRLMGSTKFGKCASAALRIANANKFCFPAGFTNNKFYLTDQTLPGTATINPLRSNASCETDPTCSSQIRVPHSTHSEQGQDHDAFCAALDWENHARALALTLVVPANSSKINVARVLMEPNNGGQNPVKSSNSFSTRRHKSSTHRSCNGDSPIPKLDIYILSLSRRGGIQGKIRAWSMDYHIMSYQMSDNRYCENIGRAHKSNNTCWNVDLRCSAYFQTCHDPECRLANFRGSTLQLPEEVAADISDFLLDEELAAIDEDKIIRDANNTHLDFGDSEFDTALGDLDMSLFTSKSGSNGK